MARKYKVIQCPECLEYTYIPLGVHRNFCPRCNAKIALHALEGEIIESSQTAQRLVQDNQYALHGLVKPTRVDETHHSAKQVLQILRNHRSEAAQWLPLHELFQQCIEAGLRPKDVHAAIDFLSAKGFLEKREEWIRAIPLN
jgi:hypothetical protein